MTVLVTRWMLTGDKVDTHRCFRSEDVPVVRRQSCAQSICGRFVTERLAQPQSSRLCCRMSRGAGDTAGTGQTAGPEQPGPCADRTGCNSRIPFPVKQNVYFLQREEISLFYVYSKKAVRQSSVTLGLPRTSLKQAMLKM